MAGEEANRRARFKTSLAVLLVAAWYVGGCGKQGVPAVPNTARPAKAPPLPAGARVQPGILVHNVLVPHAEGSTRVWIYLPENRSKAKLPCVLIAPAGTRGFHGVPLGDGDMPEHLPYVRAGFAVVAYELWGPLSETAGDAEAVQAARAFQFADGGLVNARAALNYTLARVPQIDRKRIFTAGHSSAATVSLVVAAREPRVKACVAYAPACYLTARMGPEVIGWLSSEIPGYGTFIERISPDHNIATLRCPVFLFHADDDSNVPVTESERFAGELGRINARVTLQRVPTGDHYDSMIQQGIPAAIRWLERL